VIVNKNPVNASYTNSRLMSKQADNSIEGYVLSNKWLGAVPTSTVFGSLTNNNIAVTSGVLRASHASANYSITGIAGGLNGQTLSIINISAFQLTIPNDSASSTAANRILTPSGASLVVLAGRSVDLVYDSTTARWRVTSGSATGGGGGGGGGSLQWLEGALSPMPSDVFNTQTFVFGQGLTQFIYTTVAVPTSYIAGSPVTMNIDTFADAPSGTLFFQSTATLIRPGTTALDSTANQRVSTNVAQAIPGARIPIATALDLSSTTGQINGVALAPGDLIKVLLTRTASDTVAADAFLLPYTTEVLFT
jgi:hypothetical protein